MRRTPTDDPAPMQEGHHTRPHAGPGPATSSAEADAPPRDVEVVVVGAGQAGLSVAWHLQRRGLVTGREVLVLDGNEGPGGAWRHRWPSLRLDRAHRIHPLPGADFSAADPHAPAAEVVPAWFGEYEERHDIRVQRPVRVREVRDPGDGSGRLLVDTDRGRWSTRVLVNATGTWTRPFRPWYPGIGQFAGEQLHTVDHGRADDYAGRHVVVVGGGHSAVQLLAEISAVTSTTWVTRREPVWRDDGLDVEAGRQAVARVRARVEAGLRPESVVAVTGLVHTAATLAARDRGALERLPMFDRIVRDGVVWDDGRFVRTEVILWCTGFRAALDHLAPLGLREPSGGVEMRGTRAVRDPRVHLLGYGPSASTIGANRAGREAAAAIVARLAEGQALGASA